LNIAFTLDKHQCGGPSPNFIKSLGVQSILSLEHKIKSANSRADVHCNLLDY